MVLFNYSTKELTAKVVYYGPGLCGKTTNLQWIHEKLPIRNKGKMLSLATEADVHLDANVAEEACPLGLAPTASTTAALALGDALAVALLEARGFGEEDFARFHPGGSLGRKLAKVEEAMRPLDQCRLARAEQTVREALLLQSRPGRRTGAVMIVDDKGRLSGIFTDSDLAKLLEARRESCIDGPLAEVMTCGPTAVETGTRLVVACQLLADRKISELPVINALKRY